MDPLSQGALGASLSQSASKDSKIVAAGVLGCLAGMAPDLDVLIRSSTDPLLVMEYHRQFTHSLIFIPAGALICALVLHGFVRRRLAFRESYLFCLLGYATHGLLDACTTYGTQLLWPFSTTRVAWNNVSVVDPLFTLPVLALVIAAAIKRRPLLARLAVAWAVVYLLFGVVQGQRAQSVGRAIAEARGHEPVRLEAKPGFANLMLWKVIYEHEDRYHVDAVRMGWQPKVFPGASIEKLQLGKQLPWLDPTSRQAKDVERFRWFSDDYLAMDQRAGNRIVDMRYSMVPNQIEGLWGIALDPGAAHDQHAAFFTDRSSPRESLRKLVDMLLQD